MTEDEVRQLWVKSQFPPQPFALCYVQGGLMRTSPSLAIGELIGVYNKPTFQMLMDDLRDIGNG